MNKKSPLSQEVLRRKEILSSTREQLKKEFVGIDNIIDQLMESVSSWYLFPNMHDKPVIINLWGLTGVGKSSLVKRFSELIHFKEKYIRFDMGDNNSPWSVKNKLEKFLESESGFPFILAFDEFQHARTIKQSGEEKENQLNRVVWDLLDSGKFPVNRGGRCLDDLFDLIAKLSKCVKNGVRAEKGVVTKNPDFFTSLLQIDPKRDYSNYKLKKGKDYYLNFIPGDFDSDLTYMTKEMFGEPIVMRDHLNTLNHTESIDFLVKAYQLAMSPKELDCSRCLIFILGNLDEAYYMSADFNPDISADEFHEQSLKINVTQIKSALKKRFRSEQIARLGNNHLIYPAFDSDSFKKIIGLELEKIKKRIFQLCSIDTEFTNAMRDVIYSEGVYPTQGTRPVYTTVNQLVHSRLGRFYYEAMFCKAAVKKAVFHFEEYKFIISLFDKHGKLLNKIEEKAELNMEKLRKENRDDLQAITAVHEAGHTVLSIALLQTIPEYAYSVTADAESGGFIYSKLKSKYISRAHMLNRAAAMLGGYAAEKLIFGGDHVTAGSESDIFRATKFLADAVRTSGLGDSHGYISAEAPLTNHCLFDPDHQSNNEIKQLYQSSLDRAFEVLKRERLLLLRISDFLSDNRMINKETLKEYVRKFSNEVAVEKVLSEKGEEYYRNKLKNAVKEIDESSKAATPELHAAFSLNKSKPAA